MGDKLSVDQHRAILDLLAKGISCRSIGRDLGLHHSTILKYADRELENPKAAPSETHRLARENQELRKQAKAAMDQALKETRLADFFGSASSERFSVPDWTRKSQTEARKERAIPTAFLSDLHLDEVVFPEQVLDMNQYNRKIAEKRLALFFENALKLSFDYIKGIHYDGLVLPLGGDIFSGNIHEELRLTNAATLIQSLIHWPGFFVAGIRMLRKEFRKIHIPCVVGNHGRNSMKPIAKNRPQDNFDYLFYHMLARELADDSGITFDISESADCTYQIYGTTYLLTHGDQFRGGGGIAGLLSPLMIGDHRKRKRQSAMQKPYQYMVMGHWHQLAHFKGIIVNGTLKGYDEYAFQSNFDYEPPQQAFWLTQPNLQNGKTIDAPIHVTAKEEKYPRSVTRKRNEAA